MKQPFIHKRFWGFPLVLLFYLFLAGCSRPGSLVVEDAWARPGNVGGNSAVYFVIDNPESQDDTLLDASTGIARQVELHRSTLSDDSTMSMHHQETIPVPARDRIVFEPGGLHAMLVDLSVDLKAGDTFPFTLRFQTAGEIELEVAVKEE
jgi:copper(I)-binding protein